MYFSLTFLNRFDIKNEAEGLTEPSGVCLSKKKKSLWIVSDDTAKLFKTSLKGQIKNDKSFAVTDSEMEGVTLSADGKSLLLVKESSNEIVKFSVQEQKLEQQVSLTSMQAYEQVQSFFEQSVNNKGLEGICLDRNNDFIYVLKEGFPGLLIQISMDLTKIINYRVLNHENGFVDAQLESQDIDFSDVCYDVVRDQFWIISDQAKRLYLYDWNQNSVIQSARLGYALEGEYAEIDKAEGVAIDTEKNRLYVVSDSEAHLYVYDIRT